jgi:hypothetical protein
MWYARFIQEVNQVKADRDTDLTMLVVSFLFSPHPLVESFR